MNFVLLVVSTVIALVSFGGFESMIVTVEARAEALQLEIATDDRMLRRAQTLVQMSVQTERQLRACHLLDPVNQQVILVFRHLDAIARRRRIQIMAFRHQLVPGASLQREPALQSNQLDVTFEGGYPALLAALADLSRSPLIMHSGAASFERSGNRVRAALSLAVYRLGESNVRNE